MTDTSWWLEEGWSLSHRCFPGPVIIPSRVLRELDGLKKNPSKGRRALAATRVIYHLVRSGKGTRVYARVSGAYLSSLADEEGVALAKRFRRKGYRVLLLSTDYAQRALAESQGVETASSLVRASWNVRTLAARLLRGVIVSLLAVPSLLSIPASPIAGCLGLAGSYLLWRILKAYS